MYPPESKARDNPKSWDADYIVANRSTLTEESLRELIATIPDDQKYEHYDTVVMQAFRRSRSPGAPCPELDVLLAAKGEDVSVNMCFALAHAFIVSGNVDFLRNINEKISSSNNMLVLMCAPKFVSGISERYNVQGIEAPVMACGCRP